MNNSGFSTINESSLHNELKNLYCTKNNGKTEVPCDGHVYDILTEKNEVIEIQTKNLSKLYTKISDALQKGHKVTIIHPLCIIKTIETYPPEGKLLSRKKSPKKGHILDLFSELTGIYPLLLNENFTLEILEANITEVRNKTKEKVQTLQKSRRFKKDWIKTDKKLDSIICTRKFSSAKDYLALLPKNLEKEFCAKDIENLLQEDKSVPKRVAKNAHLILWVLVRMGIIKETQKKGRSKFYTINQKM